MASPTAAPVAAPVPPQPAAQGRPMPPASNAAPAAPAAPSAPSAPAANVTVPNGQPTGGTVTPPTGGETTKPKRRGRAKLEDDPRDFYPGLKVDAEKNPTVRLKSAELPGDYDEEKHLPLRRRDFEDEATFLDYRANRLEAEVQKIRKEADYIRQFGTGERQKQVKKLEKMTNALAQMEKDFAGQGIDFAKILADMQARAQAKLAEGEKK